MTIHQIGGRPKVRYLLLHAYGRGGTIRTVMNQANSLVQAGWQVELVSALRRRDDLQFPLDPRVKVTTVVDQREEAHTPPSGMVGRWQDWRRGGSPSGPRGTSRAASSATATSTGTWSSGSSRISPRCVTGCW